MSVQNVYKFFEKKYANDFMNGKFRVSTLDYYRNMEAAEAWIKDEEEGTQTVTFGSYTYKKSSPTREAERRKLKSLGMHLEGENIDNIQIVDSRMKLCLAPHFVFCTSMEPFEMVRKAMCDDAPIGYQKDACIEITDVDGFEAAVQNGSVQGFGTVRDCFDLFLKRSVRYEKKAVEFSSRDEFGVDPFEKPPGFKPQQEYRFVWRPRQPLGDHLFIEFTPVKGLLTERAI